MTNKTTSAIDLVELVARAICSASGDHWFGSNAYAKENERWFKLAHTAIEAQSDTITRLQAALTEAREFIDAAGGFTPHREGADEMLRRIDAALSSVGGE